MSQSLTFYLSRDFQYWPMGSKHPVTMSYRRRWCGCRRLWAHRRCWRRCTASPPAPTCTWASTPRRWSAPVMRSSTRTCTRRRWATRWSAPTRNSPSRSTRRPDRRPPRIRRHRRHLPRRPVRQLRRHPRRSSQRPLDVLITPSGGPTKFASHLHNFIFG